MSTSKETKNHKLFFITRMPEELKDLGRKINNGDRIIEATDGKYFLKSTLGTVKPLSGKTVRHLQATCGPDSWKRVVIKTEQAKDAPEYPKPCNVFEGKIIKKAMKTIVEAIHREGFIRIFPTGGTVYLNGKEELGTWVSSDDLNYLKGKLKDAAVWMTITLTETPEGYAAAQGVPNPSLSKEEKPTEQEAKIVKIGGSTIVSFEEPSEEVEAVEREMIDLMGYSPEKAAKDAKKLVKLANDNKTKATKKTTAKAKKSTYKGEVSKKQSWELILETAATFTAPFTEKELREKIYETSGRKVRPSLDRRSVNNAARIQFESKPRQVGLNFSKGDALNSNSDQFYREADGKFSVYNLGQHGAFHLAFNAKGKLDLLTQEQLDALIVTADKEAKDTVKELTKKAS